ncbi:Myosin 15 [Caligus rogercresseyi]|uniref:Myosin 15 n=1 Tax=Caligus rogercresseyi TaxID=217165 RepID=A0A7T8JVI3_CALRO|nr:Myosin 15 [Caligus rogercresseyi]
MRNVLRIQLIDSNAVRKLKLSHEMKNRLEAAVIKNHSMDENGKLELSELEMHDDDDDEVNRMNSGIHRLSENRKYILEQKINKLRKTSTNSEETLSRSRVEDAAPPPRQFVFPGSLSTKTGGRLSRAKIQTEDLFESTIKNRHNSIEVLSREDGEGNEDDYQCLDEVSTKLHPPNSSTSYLYTRNVPWNLHIRKEIFSPSESLSNPLLIHLIFTQIVKDASRAKKPLRLTVEESTRLRTLLDEYSITLENVGSTKHRLSTKKNIIEEDQFLSISHKGVRLIRRIKSYHSDHFETLETYTYEDIGEISTIKSSGLQIVTHTGARLLVSNPKAPIIKDLLNTYLIEANASSYDYVKAIGDFSSGDENAISFRKGDIIAVVPKRDSYTEKGLLYGIKDGSYGLFPKEFVEVLSPKSIRREMRIIAQVTQRSKEEQLTRVQHEEEEEDEPVMTGQTDEEEDEEDDEVVAKVGGNQYAWDYNRGGESKNLVMSKKRVEGHSRKEIIQEVTAAEARDLSHEAPPIRDDGKNPLLEFAFQHFQDSHKIRPGLDTVEKKSNSKTKKGKSSKKQQQGSSGGLSGTVATNDWTWKDKVDLVKWTPAMISCFACIMRVMGDLPLLANQHEVDCVNTILMYCHKFESIRDEVYCQIMKQTTNNKSHNKDSCQKGWRLFSIIAAYFSCSEVLKPYLFKYLESAAYDKRRAYHGTALVCLQNLRKTFKYGGRKNIPSIEEITAIVAGRSSKRQIYRLPGGTERIINTKSTTVVADVIDELCNFIGVEGETFTMPLSNRHYILDLTNGLQHQHEEFYLIFYNALYVEVVFNQIAPDYLEGHLLVMPDGALDDEELVYDIAKIASLLHKAADMNNPHTELQGNQSRSMGEHGAEQLEGCGALNTGEAKSQVLTILTDWPLFGSSFFAVTRLTDAQGSKGPDVEFSPHEEARTPSPEQGRRQLPGSSHTQVISTRKVEIDDRSLYLDMKCGNLMSQTITRIKTFQADEIARLIRQYITIDQKLKGGSSSNVSKGRRSLLLDHFQ